MSLLTTLIRRRSLPQLLSPTPAAYHGRDTIVKTLLAAGADRSITSGSGQNALSYAQTDSMRTLIETFVRPVPRLKSAAKR